MNSTRRDGGWTTARGAVVFVVSCLLAAVLVSGVVGGYAYVAEPTPAEGEQVETPPEELTLEFAGDDLWDADVAVTGPSGDRVDGGATVEANRTVTVPLQDDGEGVYEVSWEATSGTGNATSGTYSFVVGDGEFDREGILESHDDDDEESGVPLGASAAKGLLLLGAIGLVGVPLTLTAVVAPATRRFDVESRTGSGRARSLVAGSALVTLAAAALAPVVRTEAVAGGPLAAARAVVGTLPGTTMLVQLVVAAVTVVAVWLGMRRNAPRWWLGASIAGGIAVAVTVAWTSNAATLVDQVRGTWVDLGHVFGAAVWVGGLLVLGAVVPPYLRAADDATAPRIAARATALFSVVAVFGVGLVIATGLLLTAWHVPDLAALWETTYGALLSAKVAIVLLAVGLGGLLRAVLLRRLGSTGERSAVPGLDPVRADGGRMPDRDTTVRLFVTAVRIEVIVLLLVVLLAAGLSSAPTAAMVADQPDDGEAIVQAGDVELVFEPTPSEARDDRLVAPADEPVVFDVSFRADGQPASADDGVTVTLFEAEGDRQLSFELAAGDDGRYSAVQEFPGGGEWTVRVDAFVDGDFISELFVVQAGDHYGTDAGGAGEEGGESERSVLPIGSSSLFTVLLQSSAVLVGLLGSLAVLGEARRTSFPRRVRADASAGQFSSPSEPRRLGARRSVAARLLGPPRRTVGRLATSIRRRRDQLWRAIGRTTASARHGTHARIADARSAFGSAPSRLDRSLVAGRRHARTATEEITGRARATAVAITARLGSATGSDGPEAGVSDAGTTDGPAGPAVGDAGSSATPDPDAAVTPPAGPDLEGSDVEATSPTVPDVDVPDVDAASPTVPDVEVPKLDGTSPADRGDEVPDVDATSPNVPGEEVPVAEPADAETADGAARGPERTASAGAEADAPAPGSASGDSSFEEWVTLEEKEASEEPSFEEWVTLEEKGASGSDATSAEE